MFCGPTHQQLSIIFNQRKTTVLYFRNKKIPAWYADHELSLIKTLPVTPEEEDSIQLTCRHYLKDGVSAGDQQSLLEWLQSRMGLRDSSAELKGVEGVIFNQTSLQLQMVNSEEEWWDDEVSSNILHLTTLILVGPTRE